MKSYTDIEQSKKLAEFLPIENADMWYHGHCSPLESERKYDDEPCPFHSISPNWDKPCWSLTALLSVLPIVYTNNKKEVCGPIHIDIADSETPFILWYVNPSHKGSIVELQTKEYNNLVDACYEMILELKKRNLI